MEHIEQAKALLDDGFTDDAAAHALIAIAELLERIDDALRNTVGGRS